MNQITLYNVLNNAGCRITSFEDYPQSNGSWRVNFFYHSLSCEIISNRLDCYIKFMSKNDGYIKHQKTIDTENNVADSKEINIIEIWLSFIIKII